MTSPFSPSSVAADAPARPGDGSKQPVGNGRRAVRGAAARRLLIFLMAALLIPFTFQMKTHLLIIRHEKIVPDARRWTFYPPLGQPIPPAFVHADELRTTDREALRRIADGAEKVAMSPEVYVELTNRIRGLKHARKPLRIMINSHPCAGKSAFIAYVKYAGDGRHPPELMGCKLIDVEWLSPELHDSSYLMQNATTGYLAVTNRTAMLGDSVRASRSKKFDDVIYIYVIPPLAIIERNIERRQEKDGLYKWSRFDKVIERRQASLLQTTKDGMLVEPLFPSFQEGLEFCIKTYDIDTRVDDPDRSGAAIVKIQPSDQSNQ